MNHKKQRQLTEDQRRKWNREKIAKDIKFETRNTTLKRRPTRRSKTKKPTKTSKWRKEYAQALKDQEAMKREFTRKIVGLLI